MLVMVEITCSVCRMTHLPTWVLAPSTHLAAGCDCYAYGLLAAGFADIVCEADLKPYDYMALIPIIKVI